MESNPDEFITKVYGRPRRWDWVITAVISRVEHKHKASNEYKPELPYLSNDEVDALYNKYMGIQGNAFTERIMRDLLDSESESLKPIDR